MIALLLLRHSQFLRRRQYGSTPDTLQRSSRSGNGLVGDRRRSPRSRLLDRVAKILSSCATVAGSHDCSMSTLAIMHSLRRPNGYLEILVREPFVGGNRLQASRPDETRSRIRNCQCAAYIRIARKGIHFMSYSLINSVPSPGITSRRLIKLRVGFQWTIRKAVAWSFRYKSWRTK